MLSNGTNGERHGEPGVSSGGFGNEPWIASRQGAESKQSAEIRQLAMNEPSQSGALMRSKERCLTVA